MAYPLDRWKELKRGFKFGEIYPNGFGSLTGHPHIGIDIIVKEGYPILAPFQGKASQFVGPQGGKTVTLLYGSDKIRFMHLSKFAKTGAVKEGDILGYTGNTGLSTAPHVHIDCYSVGSQRYVDPEIYFKPKNVDTIYTATVGMSEGIFFQFKQIVAQLTAGKINLQRTEYAYKLPVPMNQDTAYFIANTLNCAEKYVFFCLPSTLTWQMSYYYPKLNQCISAMTLMGTPQSYAFELKHQLTLWYNENRGSLPHIENMDWNAPTDDMIKGELAKVIPHLELLTGLRVEDNNLKKELVERIVKKLYKTWLQKDESGVAYWSGIVDSPEKLENFIDQKLEDIKKAVND